MEELTDYYSIVWRIVNEGVVFLIGDGASESLGYPSSELLAERMADYFNYESTRLDLGDVVKGILEAKKAKREDLVAWIRSEFKSVEEKGDMNLFNNPYYYLAVILKEILARNRKEGRTSNLYFFTTNFDGNLVGVFEKELKRGKDFDTFASNRDFSKTENTPIRIYLLHGDIGLLEDGKDTLVLTEQDHKNRKNYNVAMYKDLKSAVKDYPLFIVGQSLREKNIKKIYQTIKTQIQGIKTYEVNPAGRSLEDAVEIRTELLPFLETLVPSFNRISGIGVPLRQQQVVELSFYNDFLSKLEEAVKINKSIVLYGQHFSGKTTFINYLISKGKFPPKYKHVNLGTFSESENGRQETRNVIGTATIAEATYYEREWLLGDAKFVDKQSFLKSIEKHFSRKAAEVPANGGINHMETKIYYEDAEMFLDYYSKKDFGNLFKDTEKRKKLIRLGSYGDLPPRKGESSGGILIPPLLERVVRDNKDKNLEDLSKIEDEHKKHERLTEEVLGFSILDSFEAGASAASQISSFLKGSASAFLSVLAASPGIPVAGLVILGISGITSFYKGKRDDGLKRYVEVFKSWNNLPVEKRIIISEVLDRKSKIPPGSSYSFLSHWLTMREGSLDDESEKFLRKLEGIFTKDFIAKIKNVVDEFPAVKAKLEEIDERVRQLEDEIRSMRVELVKVTAEVSSIENVIEEHEMRLRAVEEGRKSLAVNTLEGCVNLFGLSIGSVSTVYITDKMREKADFIFNTLVNDGRGRKGKIAIIGEPGAGKTTLLIIVLEKLFQYATEHREVSVLCGLPSETSSGDTIYAYDNLLPAQNGPYRPADKIMSSMSPIVITCTRENWKTVSDAYGNANAFTVVDISGPVREWYGHSDLKNIFKKLAGNDMQYEEDALNILAEKSEGFAIYLHFMVEHLRKDGRRLTVEVAREMPVGVQEYVNSVTSRLNIQEQSLIFLISLSKGHRLHFSTLLTMMNEIGKSEYFRPYVSQYSRPVISYQIVSESLQVLKSNGIVVKDEVANTVRFTHDVWASSKLEMIEGNIDLRIIPERAFRSVFEDQENLFDEIISDKLTSTSRYWFALIMLENKPSLAFPLLNRCIHEIKNGKEKKLLGGLIDIVPLFVSAKEIIANLSQNLKETDLELLTESPRMMIIFAEGLISSNKEISKNPEINLYLGDSYESLSKIENPKDNLLKAIDHFNNALEIYKVETYPANYAGAQNSLGTTYAYLSKIEDPKDNLLKAIDHFNNALEIYKIETYPDDYAMTHNSLGTAYADLSEIEDPKDNLLKAIDHFNNALEIYKIETYPANYAGTQYNLGIAYDQLSKIEDPKDNLLKAIDHFNNALEIYKVETYPANYAGTQNNLGITYVDLSKIEDPKDNLLKAIDHFNNALQIHTKDSYPSDYAGTQNNLGITYVDLSKIENSRINLVLSWSSFAEAAEIFRKLGLATSYINTMRLMGVIASFFNEMFGIKSYSEKLVLDIQNDLEKPAFKSNPEHASELIKILDELKKNCGIT